jgi:hypothetical protein
MNSDDTSPGAPSFTEDQLEALVKSHITKFDESRSEQENLNKATEIMVSKYGDKAGEVMTKRAKELGMSLAELKQIAGKTPAAFAQLMGTADNKSGGTMLVSDGSSKSDVGSGDHGETRDFAYYNKLRKENKSLYYSPHIQMQMMRDAEAVGEDVFYRGYR